MKKVCGVAVVDLVSLRAGKDPGKLTKCIEKWGNRGKKVFIDKLPLVPLIQKCCFMLSSDFGSV